jgi:predicted nucleic-acid-binding protein
MRAVDTNVLLRVILRDEPRQAAAADRWVERGAWVPQLALAEATWVLASVYERSAEQVATAVEMLLNHRELSVQDADVVMAALATFRMKPALGFSDCLMLEVAKRAGHIPLGTFDRDLSRVDGVERL